MKKLVFVLSMVISSFVVAAEAPLQESELSKTMNAELKRRYDAAEQSKLASSRAQVHPKRSIVAVPTAARPTEASKRLW